MTNEKQNDVAAQDCGLSGAEHLGAEALASATLPNVKAQRWEWLARLVRLGARGVTTTYIRCSAWLGSAVWGADEADSILSYQFFIPGEIDSETHLQETIQMFREIYPRGFHFHLSAVSPRKKKTPSDIHEI